MDKQELPDGLTLRRGDVVWARQGRKPYWPAKEQFKHANLSKTFYFRLSGTLMFLTYLKKGILVNLLVLVSLFLNWLTCI